MNAVPEIEYVTVPRTVAREHLGDAIADLRRRRMKYAGVQVALQRDTIPAGATRIGQIRGPVDAQGIAADRDHILEPGAAPLGEDDHRHSTAVVLAREVRHDAVHVFE